VDSVYELNNIVILITRLVAYLRQGAFTDAPSVAVAYPIFTTNLQAQCVDFWCEEGRPWNADHDDLIMYGSLISLYTANR